MSPRFLTISVTAALFDGLLVWRLLNRKTLSRYPYFSAFVLYDLFCDLILIAIGVSSPSWFGLTFWCAELISILLRFLLIWEIIRAILPPASALRRLAKGTLWGVSLLAIPTILVLGWAQFNLIHFSYRYVPPIFEQYLSLAQGIVLLAIAALARYYGVSLGRNLRGLVFGLGLYLTFYAMNFASLQFVRGFLPYWQLLSPVLYIGLTAFWLWSFWEYAPSPIRAGVARDHGESRQWDHLWLTTTSLVRRGHN